MPSPSDPEYIALRRQYDGIDQQIEELKHKKQDLEWKITQNFRCEHLATGDDQDGDGYIECTDHYHKGDLYCLLHCNGGHKIVKKKSNVKIGGI